MDIELTKSEMDSLSQAMKKPEFISLLNDYVDEISDPKNKAEHEAYLKQLEDGGELPPGRKLLRPQAHSCIKTFSTSKRHIKCFINLCQSEDIIPPNLERKGEGGNWQIPYAMGHPRHDQDRHSKTCLTFDCAFNPLCFAIAETSSKFMKLLCDTCIDAANQVMQAQDEKFSQDYKLMKNLKCKGTTPGSIMVNENRLKNPKDPAPPKEKTYKLSEEGPKLYKELMSTQMKSKIDEKTKEQKAQGEEDDQKDKGQDEIEKKNENGIPIPKYKIVYSSPIDLGEFIESRLKQYRRPKEAVITFHVPKLV